MRIVRTERKETASKFVNHITIELEYIETIHLGTKVDTAEKIAELRLEEKEKLAVAIIAKLEAACSSLL